MIELRDDRGYRLMCLFILIVLVCMQMHPGDVTAGRTTSMRSRIQRQIEDIMTSIDDFVESLAAKRVLPVPVPIDMDRGDEDDS